MQGRGPQRKALRTGGVAQMVCFVRQSPEFKPESHLKKKKMNIRKGLTPFSLLMALVH
jgi:hypothetical protein